MDKYAEFFKLVERYDSICIFGHAYPDGDCYGSSQGLKALLNYVYPQKKVYVIGTDFSKAPVDFPRADTVDDDVLKSSLYIAVDLPDLKRASDPRLYTLKPLGIIKIDHHVFKEDFHGLEIVEEDASSCAEIIAKIFYTKLEKLPVLAASLLYLGFTTDTNRFLYASPSSSQIGSRLLKDGAMSDKIYSSIYTKSEKSLRLSGYILSSYKKTDMGVAYIFVDNKTCKTFGYDPHSVALFVNTLERVQSSRIWLIVAEKENGQAFCELRSLGNIDVQSIAKKFTGGGHLNASGCTLDSFSMAKDVVKECEKTLYASFEYGEYLQTMIELAKKASKEVLAYYNQGVKIEIKSDNSPVTSADLASNKIILNGLRQAYKDIPILSEEEKDSSSRLNSDMVFIVDPLDGTMDFIQHTNQFAINIALVKSHHPIVSVVAIPAKGKIYFAHVNRGAYVFSSKDMIKRLHVSFKCDKVKMYYSANHQNKKFLELVQTKPKLASIEYVGSALKACQIAEGLAEVCYSIGRGTKEWDTCAPQLVVEEAGGLFLDNHLNPVSYNREDVYNNDGFTILNRKESALISIEELENIKNEK